MKYKNAPQEVKKVLERLGLTDNQIRIYYACLQYGAMGATEIAQLTKVNRQQIYKDMDVLMELGLCFTTAESRKKFSAARLNKLTEVAERRVRQSTETLSQLEDLMPALQGLAKAPAKTFSTRYFKGMDQIRHAYQLELTESKQLEVLSFVGSVDDIFEYFPESYWTKWNREFVKQGSRSRMLVHFSDQAKKTAKLDEKYSRQTRWINHFPLKTNVDVFGKHVLMVSYHEEVAVWIESPMLADSYRTIFESLWQTAKKF